MTTFIIVTSFSYNYFLKILETKRSISNIQVLLFLTSVFEISTGILLLTIPNWIVSILLGTNLNSPESFVIARIAGTALFTLALMCYFAIRDIQSCVTRGIVTAMLFYNIVASAILLAARFYSGFDGIGILPASIIHIALAVWCIKSLSAMKRIQ